MSYYILNIYNGREKFFYNTKNNFVESINKQTLTKKKIPNHYMIINRIIKPAFSNVYDTFPKYIIIIIIRE